MPRLQLGSSRARGSGEDLAEVLVRGCRFVFEARFFFGFAPRRVAVFLSRLLFAGGRAAFFMLPRPRFAELFVGRTFFFFFTHAPLTPYTTPTVRRRYSRVRPAGPIER